MLNVIKKIDEMSGGMAISSNGKLEGSLRLDIAGIMSSKSMTEVHEDKKIAKKGKRAWSRRWNRSIYDSWIYGSAGYTGYKDDRQRIV